MPKPETLVVSFVGSSMWMAVRISYISVRDRHLDHEMLVYTDFSWQLPAKVSEVVLFLFVEGAPTCVKKEERWKGSH